MKKAKGNKELRLFLLIAIGWSWLFWLPEIFWDINLYLAPFGPLVAAFFLTYLNEKKQGALRLAKRGLAYKFNLIWYLPVIFLMLIIAGLSTLIAGWLEGNAANYTIMTDPWLIIRNFIYILFLGGPLQEEFGWRGYALPRLLKNYKAVTASIILGIIWSIWHLPLNFINQAGLQYQAAITYIISSLILMVFVSILFTWIYQNTGGSIFAVLIFHTMLNLSAYVIFPVFAMKIGPLIFMGLIVLTTLIVTFVYGYQNLSPQKINIYAESNLKEKGAHYNEKI